MLTTPPTATPAVVVVPHVTTGSHADAKLLRSRLQQVLSGLSRASETLELLVDSARAHAIHLMLQGADGAYFATWEAFCVAPLPYGLGVPAEAIAAAVAERTDPKRRARLVMDAPVVLRYQALRAPVRERAPPKPRANPADYYLRRLRREHPELLAQVADGRLPSIQAAARLAGLIQPRTNVILTPLCVARLIVCHLTPAQQARVVDLLQHPEKITPPAGNHSPAWKRYQASRGTQQTPPTSGTAKRPR